MAKLIVAAAIGLVSVVSTPAPTYAADEGMGSDIQTGMDGSDQDGGSVNVEPTRTADAAPQQASDSFESIWDTLARCESTGNWHANTGNGYRGGLQFDDRTWKEFGGDAYASRADLATRGQQIAVAQRLHAARGFAPWPNCSRRLGLR